MRRWGWIAVVLALTAAACSDDVDVPAGADSTTTLVPDRSPSITSTPPVVDEPVAGDVTPVVLRGPVASAADGRLRLCRTVSATGCAYPILLHDISWSDVPLAPHEEVWGRWHPDRLEIDGTMRADGSVGVLAVRLEAIPEIWDLPCPDRTIDYPTVGGPSDQAATTAILEYTLRIPLLLGGELTSDPRRGLRIVPVIDDPAPHQAALDEVAPGRTCVVQVTNGRHEMGLLRNTLRESVNDWADRGYGEVRVDVQTSRNIVVVTVPRVDATFRAELGDRPDLIWVETQVEFPGSIDVLNQVDASPLEADLSRLFPMCNGVPVDPAVFDGPAEDHLDGHPSTIVFEQTSWPGMPPPDAKLGWWRVYENPEHVVYVNDEMGSITVRAGALGWSWAGSGGCQLAFGESLGMTIHSWESPVEADPAATGVEIDVRSALCPSVSSDEVQTIVEETATEVRITALSAPMEFDHRICLVIDGPSSVLVPVTVELTEPLGDRVLVDAGRYRADDVI